MDRSDIIRGPHRQDKWDAALAMRQAMTPAERGLWQHLKARRLAGLHFRRQQVIDGYIADFYCHAARLVVEVDGSAHRGREADDEYRDLVLSARGLVVMRFTNEQVLCEVEAVLADIAVVACERLPTPCPPS